jgi:hypothetical protein
MRLLTGSPSKAGGNPSSEDRLSKKHTRKKWGWKYVLLDYFMSTEAQSF